MYSFNYMKHIALRQQEIHMHKYKLLQIFWNPFMNNYRSLTEITLSKVKNGLKICDLWPPIIYDLKSAFMRQPLIKV